MNKDVFAEATIDEKVGEQTISYESFVNFCELFEEQNHFSFEESDIQRGEGEKGYYYDATYRDESNFKTNIRIKYDGERIKWEIDEGWPDAQIEIGILYQQQFKDLMLAEEIPFAKFQLYEAMIDIALNAGALIGTNQIIVEDSRELVQTIVRLAMEFEVTQRNGEQDYILSIDRFSEEKLKACYTIEES